MLYLPREKGQGLVEYAMIALSESPAERRGFSYSWMECRNLATKEASPNAVPSSWWPPGMSGLLCFHWNHPICTRPGIRL